MKQRRRFRFLKLEDRVTPAIATWDGGGGVIGNNNWSLPLNWVGDVAPQPGDDLVFGAAPLKVSVNDFAAGTAFRSITLSDSSYQIFGNAILLAAGINSTFANGGSIALNLTLTAPQTISHASGSGFNLSGTINLNGQLLTATINGGTGGGVIPPGPGIVTLSGPVIGSGGIVKNGVQVLSLTGNNTFTGNIDHQSGVLSFGSHNAGGASAPGNQTFVGSGAVLSVNGGLTVPESIVFAASQPTNQSQLAVGNDPTTFTGPLTLSGPSRWLGEIVLAGGLFGTGSLSVQGSLTIPAGVTSTYNGTLNAETRFFLFNGVGPTGLVTANDSQRVAGNGTIGPLTVQGSTRFAPGDNGIGTLTTGNLIEGAFYELDLGNAGSDRVVVNGTVALGGTLVVQPQAGFTPAAGSVFRIIDNDGVDPIAGAFGGLQQGAVAATINGVQLFVNYRGGDGNDVELTTTQPPPPSGPLPFYSVAAGPGGGPQVNVYSESGALVRSFFAYEASFRGGVHVATADVTGDGVRDVVTAPGQGGGPVIRIWDGVSGDLLTEYNAFDPNFRGGAFVATGRMNSDLAADIIIGAGSGGGPHVKVINAATTQLLSQFMAYDLAFTGGVSVGGIDGYLVGGDAFVPGTVVTGAGPGGGPHVKRFNGLGGGPLDGGFFAYEGSFRGGVFVAGGSTADFVGTPNEHHRIVVTPGSGRSAEVKVFETNGVLDASFIAYDPLFQGGATVAVRPGFDFGVIGIITGAGRGGGPHAKEFGIRDEVRGFFAFDPAFMGGVFVG